MRFFPGSEKISQILQRDDVRTSIQTVAAVLIAYGSIRLLAVGSTSWAVFSALFVVQSNVGETVGLAIWRVLGAALGAIVVILLIIIIGKTGSKHEVLVLAAGVFVMSVLTVRFPRLSYGLVTVAILAVMPDFQIIETSLEKVLAIFVGSSSAILACMIIFPVSALHTANMQLATALRISGKSLNESMNCFANDRVGETENMRRQIDSAIQRAWFLTKQSSVEMHVFVFWNKRYLSLTDAVLIQAAQLQQDLALVDRLSRMRPSCQLNSAQKAAVEGLGAAVHEQLNNMGEAVMRRHEGTDISVLWSSLECLSRELDTAYENTKAVEPREFFMAFKWASHSLASAIDELARHIWEARTPHCAMGKKSPRDT